MYSSALINFILKQKKKKLAKTFEIKWSSFIIIETEWFNLVTYVDNEFHAVSFWYDRIFNDILSVYGLVLKLKGVANT